MTLGFGFAGGIPGCRGKSGKCRPDFRVVSEGSSQVAGEFCSLLDGNFRERGKIGTRSVIRPAVAKSGRREFTGQRHIRTQFPIVRADMDGPWFWTFVKRQRRELRFQKYGGVFVPMFGMTLQAGVMERKADFDEAVRQGDVLFQGDFLQIGVGSPVFGSAAGVDPITPRFNFQHVCRVLTPITARNGIPTPGLFIPKGAVFRTVIRLLDQAPVIEWIDPTLAGTARRDTGNSRLPMGVDSQANATVVDEPEVIRTGRSGDEASTGDGKSGKSRNPKQKRAKNTAVRRHEDATYSRGPDASKRLRTQNTRAAGSRRFRYVDCGRPRVDAGPSLDWKKREFAISDSRTVVGYAPFAGPRLRVCFRAGKTLGESSLAAVRYRRRLPGLAG